MCVYNNRVKQYTSYNRLKLLAHKLRFIDYFNNTANVIAAF